MKSFQCKLSGFSQRSLCIHTAKTKCCGQDFPRLHSHSNSTATLTFSVKRCKVFHSTIFRSIPFHLWKRIGQHIVVKKTTNSFLVFFVCFVLRMVMNKTIYIIIILHRPKHKSTPLFTQFYFEVEKLIKPDQARNICKITFMKVSTCFTNFSLLLPICLMYVVFFRMFTFNRFYL